MTTMTSEVSLTIVFGAMDPEAERAMDVAKKSGARIVKVVNRFGNSVKPHEAYNKHKTYPSVLPGDRVVLFECDPDLTHGVKVVARCDHHRPGDPGYGRPPEEYWEASSLGQLCAILGVEPDDEMRIVAAADHCLAAAYAGRCPGVDPRDLLEWRVSCRAEFQGRPKAEVLSDITAACSAIRSARRDSLGVADLRARPVRELPEASARMGVPVLYRLPAGPNAPDGASAKEGILGDLDGAAVRTYMERWRQDEHTVGNPWGDPTRGFAGRWVRG